MFDKISEALKLGSTAIATCPVKDLALAILVPTSLGFLHPYLVYSYAYGLSIACAALLAHQDATSSLSKLHAILHIAYGYRLCLFLAYRDIFVPSFQEKYKETSKDDIATVIALLRRVAQRFAMVAGCAALYLFMSCPLLITSAAIPLPAGSFAQVAAWGALGLGGIGLALQITGDTHKSIAKARGKGLITGGVYSLCRHPNYTGEIVLWTASTMVAMIIATTMKQSIELIALEVASLVGLAGIVMVLMNATARLEKKQSEKYAGKGYESWKGRTWGGLTTNSWNFAPKAKDKKDKEELVKDKGGYFGFTMSKFATKKEKKT